MSWSKRLWAEIEPMYAAIRAHPFLSGLADGSLPQDVFAHYVTQDAHYLSGYAQALSIVGAKAPTRTDTAMFARHAAGAIEVELALHSGMLVDLGLDPACVAASPVAPTTRAYLSYLLATAYGGSFVDGLAAVLPCYWIYAEVGKALASQGSPDPRYARWIATYSAGEFDAVVAEVLALTDRIGSGLGSGEEARAREHFATTARYEWMFWDAAWRLETWPL